MPGTPANRLIDLDAVISEPVVVKLKGEEHMLPGDAPTEDLLRLSVKAERMEKEAEGKTPEELLEMREDLAGDIEDLFRLEDPDLEEGAISLADSQFRELLDRLFEIYYPNAMAAPEGGARPTGTRRKPRSSRPSRAKSGGKGRKARASSTS